MRPEPEVVLGDRYVLVRRIAVGGMGEVWEATDTLLDRLVAVKILKEEFRTGSTFLARFRAEARHAGQLIHPGIATVYDYGETSDLAFLVMELVRGRPLSELMVEQPALPTMTKLSILAQAAEALDAAHEAGVVHRDVKPSNLMVREDGTVKVTDFGIARALTSAPLTEQGQMIGTPAYVSPEQAAGGQVTGVSDVYSLAVVAYELFTGRPPFQRDTPLALALAHVNDTPPPLPNTVPRPVAELIESALNKEPWWRPSAAYFAGQLRREMTSMQAAAARTRVLPVHRERGPVPTTIAPSSSAPVAAGAAAGAAPVADRRGFRSSHVALVVFAVLMLLMGATVWTAMRQGTGDDARSDLSVASTISEPSVAPSTSPSTEPPATETPSTAPPPTEPAVTPPPPTEPPATQPSPTVPPTTQAATTQPPTTQVATTQPATTQPATTQPPTDAATPAAVSNAGIEEGEAVAFVLDYYDRVRAGDYATTWELLSAEFRDARNLTYERYVSYWENTTIEIRNLRFAAGPGVDEARVRFDAQYDIGSRVVDETDEITLRRLSDGRVVITEQRTI